MRMILGQAAWSAWMGLLAGAALFIVLTSCATSNVPKPQIADPWVYDPATRIYTTCSVYGDRLYAMNGSALAAIPGGCR